MPERQLKLAKPWGKHPAGAVLTVHQGDAPLTKTTVDPKRAAQLLADKLATEHTAATPAPAQPAAKKEA